jgi:hypothetical protein
VENVDFLLGEREEGVELSSTNTYMGILGADINGMVRAQNERGEGRCVLKHVFCIISFFY